MVTADPADQLRQVVEESAAGLRRLLAAIDAGELTAGAPGRSYLAGALGALDALLGGSPGWCMGISEIAQRAGVSRQTVAQWHVRGKLPEPDAKLAASPVWRETTIELWLADRVGQ